KQHRGKVQHRCTQSSGTGPIAQQLDARRRTGRILALPNAVAPERPECEPPKTRHSANEDHDKQTALERRWPAIGAPGPVQPVKRDDTGAPDRKAESNMR